MIHKVAPLSRRYFGGSSPDGAAIIRHSQGMGMVHGRRGSARGQRRSVIYLFTCVAHGVSFVILFPVECWLLPPPATEPPRALEPQTLIHMTLKITPWSSPDSCWASLAVWDHTVLPVTRRK